MKDKNVLDVPLGEFLHNIAVGGAMQSDAEWEISLEEALKGFHEALNNSRAEIRMKIMQSMFRTSEDE